MDAHDEYQDIKKSYESRLAKVLFTTFAIGVASGAVGALSFGARDHPEAYVEVTNPVVRDFFDASETLNSLDNIYDRFAHNDTMYTISYQGQPGLESFLNRNFAGRANQAALDSLEQYAIGIEEDMDLMRLKHKEELRDHFSNVQAVREQGNLGKRISIAGILASLAGFVGYSSFAALKLKNERKRLGVEG